LAETRVAMRRGTIRAMPVRLETLGVAKRCVRLVSGSASRRKVLEIDGVTAEAIAAKLGSNS
jgi:uncharacterized protein YggU (UPF0235/DUF167 family)